MCRPPLVLLSCSCRSPNVKSLDLEAGHGQRLPWVLHQPWALQLLSLSLPDCGQQPHEPSEWTAILKLPLAVIPNTGHPGHWDSWLKYKAVAAAWE